MNTLEARLVEINAELLKLAKGEKPNDQLMQQAYQVLSGRSYSPINTGNGNDTVIINNGDNKDECNPGPPGPIGYTGSRGENGYTGSQGDHGYTGSQGYTGSAGSGEAGYTGSQGADGSNGYTGSQGELGPIGYTGSAGAGAEQCTAILVSQDYTINVGDYYIGVNSTGPVTITLPADPADCLEFIIKAQMGPPLGNRKVTITTSDGATIDVQSNFQLIVPYQSVNVISQGGNWWIV